MDSRQYLLLTTFMLFASSMQTISTTVPDKTYNLTINNKTGKNESGWGACRVDVMVKGNSEKTIVPRGKSAKLNLQEKSSTLIVKTSKGSWELDLDFTKNNAVFSLNSKDISDTNSKWLDGVKLKGKPRKI